MKNPARRKNRTSFTTVTTVACSRYNLRRTEFTLPRNNSVTYGKHSLRYLGPKLWNMLPEKLRKLPSVQTLKKQIRNTMRNT